MIVCDDCKGREPLDSGERVVFYERDLCHFHALCRLVKECTDDQVRRALAKIGARLTTKP